MKSFEIAEQDAEVLREVLESYLKEIELEVSRVDSMEFKQMLKHRRDVVERILGKLAVPFVPA